MSYNIIGTCSRCGGQVATPLIWGATVPPIPSCLKCGAQAAMHGPVIPMMPAPSPTKWKHDLDASLHTKSVEKSWDESVTVKSETKDIDWRG